MKSKKRPLLKKYQLGTGWGGGPSSGTISTWQPSQNSPTAGNLSFADPGKYSNASVIPEGSMLEGKDLSGGGGMSGDMSGGMIGTAIAAALNTAGGITQGIADQTAAQNAIDAQKVRGLYAYDRSKSPFAEEYKKAETTSAVMGGISQAAQSVPIIGQIVGAGFGIGQAGTNLGIQKLTEKELTGHNLVYGEKVNVGGYRGNFTNQGQFTTYNDQESRPVQAKMGGYLDRYKGGGLYANIHAKRARIKAGSGEKMRSPGDKGAPTAKAFTDSAKTAKMSMGGMLEYGKGGIYIDPAKRGTFKAQATKMDMGVQEAASKILSAPEGKYSPEMRKKANFAKNFAKENGGYLKQYMGGGIATSTGVPRQYANAELEGGEIVEKQMGPDVYVKGPSHEKGGVPMVLQEGGPAEGGDYVWSDHLTYNGKSMAEWYEMAVNNGASEQEIDQLRMLQEQLAGRAGEPQDAKELQEMPSAKNGGMLKKYQTGSALGTRTFGEKMGDYVPEIASGIGALAQTIATATAKNPYKGLEAPKEERVSTDKQFFERTDARTEMAQNERQATLSKQLLQQAGAGPSEIAALQKVDLERQAADATAVQRAREFNIQQDRAEKQLNTELKLRADMANQAAANEMAKLAYERDFGERMFETQRGQAIGDAVSGMAGDVAKYASDYRYAKAIQGKNLSKRASTYDRDKARAIIESQNPWDKSKGKMTYAEWDAMIDQKVNEDAALHQKSM